MALFEPERAMMPRLPGGEPNEIQVEGAISTGLPALPRGFADLRTIPGWALHRLDDDRIELRSPDGSVYSRITIPASPDWYSAALHHGYVVCFYGPQLEARVRGFRNVMSLEPSREVSKDAIQQAGSAVSHRAWRA